jgi:capsid protein
VKNGAGGVSAEKMRMDRFNVSTTKSDGTESTKTLEAHLKNVIGGRTVYLKPGEEIQQFASNRPSVAVQQYWDLLISEVCIGFGIPAMLAFPKSIQGTVARADLDVANGFFRSRHQVLAAAWQEVYRYVIGEARFFDKRLAKFPADWWKVTTRPPRAVNVDVGRNSAAMLAELEAGATTYEDIYTPLGQDWRDRIRQRAREIAYLNQVAKEEGVDPGQIAEALKPDTRTMEQPRFANNSLALPERIRNA